MLKDKVELLVKESLEQEESLFLIDLTISPDHSIKVIIDGDQGVSLQDCMKVSRAIENNLDREVMDFSLEVTSAGATSPIVLPRQFKKNIGRKLKIWTEADTYEGNLVETGKNGIVLEWKAREPKPIGKGKVTVQKRKEIDFSEIREAKVVLKF